MKFIDQEKCKLFFSKLFHVILMYPGADCHHHIHYERDLLQQQHPQSKLNYYGANNNPKRKIQGSLKSGLMLPAHEADKTFNDNIWYKMTN